VTITGVNIVVGAWTHLSVVWDAAADTVTVYQDGATAGSTTLVGGTMTTGGTIWLGNDQDSVGGGFQQNAAFDGRMSEVRLWDTARSATDIAADYNKQLVGTEEDLVGYWRLDESSGTTATDTTGNNNGTYQSNNTAQILRSPPIVAPDGPKLINNLGKALQFDGSDDVLEIIDTDTFDTANYTIETWVKLDSIANMTILGRTNSNGLSSQFSHLLHTDATGKFYHYTYDNVAASGKTALGSVTAVAGQWYHLAGTYDADTDTMKLYVDGQLQATTTGVGTPWPSGDRYQIGPNAAANNDFDGQMAEFRVWSSARTDAEIADSYNQALNPAAHSDLIGYYTFEGATGSAVTDLAGSVNGTVSGAKVVDTAPSVFGTALTGQGDATVAAITAGEETVRAVASTPVQSNAQIVNLPAKALDFDGTNDSVAVADPGTAFTNMTIEAWVHLDTLTTGVDNKMLIGNQGWTTAGDLHLQWVVNDGKKKLSWGENSNVNHFAHDFTNDLNKWQHIAVVRDTDAKELRLYLDGDLVDSIIFTTSATVRLDDSTTIGKIAGGNRYLDGQLSDFRVWQTARTGDEIKANYAQTLTGNENGELIINYPMDEVSGSTLADTAGTANNGTVTSATIVDVGNTVLGTKITITEGETATGTMTSNDVTGTATYSITSNPTLGSVVIDSTSGQWTYTPPENYAGSQTFSVRATGGGLTDTETVTVTISADAENAVHAGALQFDGVNDYVDITGATSVYTGTSNFAWEAWINTSSSGLRQDIISIGNHAQNETAFFFVNDVGKLQVDLPYQGGAASTTSVNDGNWHHVALTMNAASKVATLYIDGTADGSKTFTGNALNLVQGDGAFIGGVISSDNTYFKGMIDEVRIWNTLRTAQQISDNKDEQISSSQANLVAHYQMDDVKGGIVHDATSNAGHGALNGPGPSPGVLTLDGTDDYLDVPDAVLNNLSAGTIETWVFLDTNTSETITSKQHDGVNTTAVFSVGDSFGGTAGKLHFRPYNGQSAVGSATVATGEWVHVAVTFNSSEARFYVNGTLDSTASGNFSIPNIANATATTIGNMVTESGTYIGTGSVNSSLDGKMDEVRIWSDVRTATEIRDNMNQAIEGPSPNLVAAYSFDRDATGSTGTVLNEQGTTALNGTRTNGATVEKSETAPVNEMPKPLNGVTGNVLVLDGSNDYGCCQSRYRRYHRRFHHGSLGQARQVRRLRRGHRPLRRHSGRDGAADF